MKKSIKRLDERISLNVICVIFLIYAVTLAFPFLWLISNSLKGSLEFQKFPLALPKDIWKHISNYSIMFKEFEMGTMFYNSLFLSVASPTVSIFCHMCTAYAYAKHEFKLKKKKRNTKQI